MNNDKSGGNKACAFIRGHLISVVEDHAAGTAPRDIRDHLDSCPDCASLVLRFSRAWEDPALPADAKPAPSFFPGLVERIEAGEKPRPGRPGVLAVAWRILRPAAVAAIFLGGIFAGHELGRGERTIPPPEAAFSGRLLESFESIPPGSAADFYVNRQYSEKEGLE